jgi:hypothetical protein
MINLQSDENSFFQLLMPEQIPQQQIKRFNPPLQSQLGNNKPKGLYLTGTLMPQLRYIHFFDLQTNDLQTFQLSFSLISEAVTRLIKKINTPIVFFKTKIYHYQREWLSNFIENT